MDASADFDPWYRRLHPRLVTAMVAVTGDMGLAAEAADEACVRALERWGRVSAMASPEGWAYQVAFNVVRRRERRRSLEERLLRRAAPAAPVDGPAGEVWALLSDLAPRQRQAVVLRYLADLTEPEIAAVMGVTRGTVNATLRSALARLRDVVHESDPDPVAGGVDDG